MVQNDERAVPEKVPRLLQEEADAQPDNDGGVLLKEIPLASLGKLHILNIEVNDSNFGIRASLQQGNVTLESQITVGRIELEEFLDKIAEEAGLKSSNPPTNLTEEQVRILENYVHGRAMGLEPIEAWDIAQGIVKREKL